MGRTYRLGLLGKHISYSRSPDIYKSFLHSEETNDTIIYKLIDLPKEQIGTFVQEVKEEHSDWSGFNVTIPYKEEIIKHIDILSIEAKSIGAVNCVKVERSPLGRRLTGYNTDALGFFRTIKHLGLSSGAPALILGTGGAAKAVSYALREWLSMEVSFVSSSNRVFANNILQYGQVSEELLSSFSLIVNTTPLGSRHYLGEIPPLLYDGIHSKQILYELIYEPTITPFMSKGLEKGAIVCNGEAMLLEQAKIAWNIFKNGT